MTGLLRATETPTLPYDVLRLVFEEATKEDTHRVVKYTLISKLVCAWVEKCLYEDVKLYSDRSLRKFLRTLEFSTKSKHFFATRVKSLAIAYDIHDSERTAKILSICNGVENLTIWAIPSSDPVDVQVNSGSQHYVPLLRTPQYTSPQFAASTLGPSSRLHSLLHVFKHDVRPKRLAILVDKPLHTFDTTQAPQLGWTAVHISPDFSLALFTNLTHLSIVNRWTDWSTWIWNHDCTASRTHGTVPQRFNSLPKLTHLSLEIQVGKRLMPRDFDFPPSPTSPHHHNRKIAECVALPLARILTSPELHSRLHILLCILTFDDAPYSTARVIKEGVTNILTLLRHESELLPNLGMSFSTRLDDPRLVFAYDKEPFREREAGSYKVWNMWKRAEEIMRLQQIEEGYDPVVLEL